MDLNHPSRSDLYAAQVAAEVRRSTLGAKSTVSALDLIIELKEKNVKRKLTETERKQEIEMSKAAWLARMIPPKAAKKK